MSARSDQPAVDGVFGGFRVGVAVLVGAHGRLGQVDLAVLDDARWVFDYVQWLWYRSRFADPAAGEGRHAERLAQRLLRCNNH